MVLLVSMFRLHILEAIGTVVKCVIFNKAMLAARDYLCQADERFIVSH